MKHKGIRCCRVCNCELTSENKSGYCEMHRRKRAGTIKKAGSSLLGILGTALLIGKFLIKKRIIDSPDD